MKLPITLAEAKKQLRIDHDDDNADILSAIRQATSWVENYVGRSLITRTYELGLSAFPECIQLPMPPLMSVELITYVDTAGTQQTLDPSSYQVQAWSDYPFVKPAYGESFPATREQENSVIVEYKSGYAEDPEDFPIEAHCVFAALKLLVGHFYENREQEIIGLSTKQLDFGVYANLKPLRIYCA